MSKQVVRGLDSAADAERGVAEYLELNPDFFERHSHLLDRLRVPHESGSAAVSLVERQVLVLREKNRKVEAKLRELVEVARSNDALAEKIHRLACALIRAGSARQALEVLERALREDFGASHWVMVLTGPQSVELATLHQRQVRLVERDSPDLRMFDSFFESARPRCGQIRDSQRDYLFGTGTDEIGSVALVPLGRQGALGLLAIGSPDVKRFHPTMSTEFLAHIGELVSEALATR